MAGMSQETIQYAAYAMLNIAVAREVNSIVISPYMDEPFHVPQAQAYCNGDWTVWDPKITTPPGLYVLSVILKRLFIFKCTTGILRLTNVLLLLTLPPILSHLLATMRRINPPRSLLEPTTESIVISAFPIAWFFSFLYYTELGSLVFVLACLWAAMKDRHWLAALLGLTSCSFRQTNIIWVLYALGASSLLTLHRKARINAQNADSHRVALLHDPPVCFASIYDLSKSITSVPHAIVPIMPSFLPYTILAAAFSVFIVWNGGIVLGDKSNHIPQLHVPQLHYFVGFSTALGLPVLVSGPGGPVYLFRQVRNRMFGSLRCVLSPVTLVFSRLRIAVSVHFFTIHHPFLLSDNRHYTFYVWNRLFRRHPVVPYLLSPAYLVCYHMWFIRVYCPPWPVSISSQPDSPDRSANPPPPSSGSGESSRGTPPPPDPDAKTLLQCLLLPICLVPTLLPTPLLEPRYFLIPYTLLRLQIEPPKRNGPGVGSGWAIIIEGVWYGVINWITMFVFLYRERENVGRFMW
ncbi:glycosyltransferase family 59 protein [Hydnum rufescens UP504]|uniref:Dol-P-Glc:Glc(2)Man(9)GlcNAc(2)-PP-Dol alpha-1,2-glucosyltransferase n=1 Tax=Hydnum rufescens UP504 TaxID=1448309 RepID=A0A9P6DR42_9AGAM|nr:glycosyltransferase family 59 protein [Hydnum rufescens UP504]